MQKHTGKFPRQTRIVATIGHCHGDGWPSFITQMLEAGPDVFRINFSHSGESYDRELEVMDCVHSHDEHSSELAAVLGDLQGPKVRIDIIEEPGLELVEGEELNLRIDGSKGEIPMNHEVGSALLRSIKKLLTQDPDARPDIVFGDGDLVMKMTELMITPKN